MFIKQKWHRENYIVIYVNVKFSNQALQMERQVATIMYKLHSKLENACFFDNLQRKYIT